MHTKDDKTKKGFLTEHVIKDMICIGLQMLVPHAGFYLNHWHC